MFKTSKILWPLISRSVKLTSRSARTVFPRCQFIIPISRSFTTTVMDNLSILQPEQKVVPVDSQWNNYLEKVSDSMTEQDFIDICKSTQTNPNLSDREKVQRLQHILLDIHTSIKGDKPELQSVFQRACNILMHTYVGEGDLKSAKLVFEGLVSSDCATINLVSIRTIIHGIQKHSTKTDLYKFVQSLEKRDLFPKDTASAYISVIYALKYFHDLRGCQFYFAEAVKYGLDTDENCYKAMMEVYRQAKKAENVLELFNTMKEKKMDISLPIYNIVLSALGTDSSFKDEMDKIYTELKESKGLSASSSTYLSMKWNPLDALDDMKKEDVSPTIRDYNEFFVHYVRKNKFPEALEVYKRMKEDENVKMDVFSYGIVMDLLVKDIENSTESVFELYHEMKDRGITPDPTVYTSLLTACRRDGDLERAMALLEEMESYHIQPNVYTFNSVLSVLSTMEGSSIIDLDRASLIWKKMTTMGIHPDIRTYNTYLSIISKLIKPIDEENLENSDDTLWGDEENEENVPKTVREMLRMYRYMRRNHHQTIKPDFATYTIVINSLSAAGQIRSAMQVYSDAKMSRVALPVTAYNEVMRALQRGGKMSEAMNVWYDMKIYGILPDSITYEIVLEACEQLGLADSLTSIRNQRKLDVNRLLELDAKKQKRMRKSRQQ
ncbi:unnamed protein product [Mucor hiemalis]